jgi:uncharacterized protein (TIGR03067 family)
VSDDKKLLQGTWQMVTFEMNGAPLPSQAISACKMIIDGDNFTAVGMGAVYEGRFTLDTSQNPRQIDMEFTAGPEKGGRSLGIYELDGNWKICLSINNAPRPSAFATAPNSNHALETFTKLTVAETKESQSAFEATLPIDISANVDFDSMAFEPSPELQGEWSLVSGVRDGLAFDDKMIKSGKRITRGCETVVSFGGQVLMKARVKVDSAKTPHEIDYYNTEGIFAGKIQYGIYEMNNGILKVIFAVPGNPRPADFTVKPGDYRTLTVWKK